MTTNPLPNKHYGSTLTDCNSFASLFSNTCTINDLGVNVAATNIIFLTPKTIQCEDTGPNCVDAGSRQQDSVKCDFDRKLCISCTQPDASGPVCIRVQSNGLPESCFWGFNEVKE